MACSGFGSIRTLVVVFQVTIFFVILKLLNVDQFLTNFMFRETFEEQQKLPPDTSSSRYHHRIQEHHWISESEEIENPGQPVVSRHQTNGNDQKGPHEGIAEMVEIVSELDGFDKENMEDALILNNNPVEFGMKLEPLGADTIMDTLEQLGEEDSKLQVPLDEDENPVSDEKKYLQDLYDLREQEYDPDYEEEDYEDYEDDDYNGVENKENVELNVTELGFIPNLISEPFDENDEEVDDLNNDEDSLEETGEVNPETDKDPSSMFDGENNASTKEPFNTQSNHHKWTRQDDNSAHDHGQPEKAPRRHYSRANNPSPRFLRIQARRERAKKISMADATCHLQIVETVPQSLRRGGFAKKMPVEHMSTFQAWQLLVDLAQNDFRIVSQWGIGRRGRGVDFYKSLAKAVTERNVQLSVVFTKKFSGKSGHSPIDMKLLSPRKVMIRLPSIEKKIDGKTKGIIHSKMLISDGKHFYLGSANLGTRCTTWTKEIGMLVTNCPELAKDAVKLHEIYMGIDKELPSSFPKSLSAAYNMRNPLKIYNPSDETLYKVYLGSSPRRLCANGRTDDLTAITNIIDNAEKFVYIAVGEYLATDIFKEHKSWTTIDDRLRAAMRRNVIVRFLGNDLASHKNWMKKHLISLLGMNKINKNVKLMEAKLYKANIRRFHGSHNKILVTEKAGYLGTSNWAEDYFSTTAGLGFAFEPVIKGYDNSTKFNLRDQLEHVFLRDYYSSLAYLIN